MSYAKKLNERGCSAFVVHYRIEKKAKIPAPQDDSARVVKDTLARAEELNLDTEAMDHPEYNLPQPGEWSFLRIFCSTPHRENAKP